MKAAKGDPEMGKRLKAVLGRSITDAGDRALLREECWL